MTAFIDKAKHVSFKTPRVPMVSAVSGQLFEPGFVPGPEYWWRQPGQPQTEAGIRALGSAGFNAFVQIGPASRFDPSAESAGAGRWLASIRRNADDWEVLLGALGALFVSGATVDWKGFERDYPRRLLHLPTYPFERKRCWIEASEIRDFPGPFSKVEA